MDRLIESTGIPVRKRVEEREGRSLSVVEYRGSSPRYFEAEVSVSDNVVVLIAGDVLTVVAADSGKELTLRAGDPVDPDELATRLGEPLERSPAKQTLGGLFFRNNQLLVVTQYSPRVRRAAVSYFVLSDEFSQNDNPLFSDKWFARLTEAE